MILFLTSVTPEVPLPSSEIAKMEQSSVQNGEEWNTIRSVLLKTWCCGKFRNDS